MFKGDRLVHFLSLLPVVTAGLYFFGVVFHQGYMRTLGLEESLFPLTVDRYLFEGFIAILTVGILSAFYAVLAAELIFLGAELFVFAASFAWKSPPRELPVKANALAIKDDNEVPKGESFRAFSERMLKIAALFLGAVALLILAGQFADWSAQNAGERFIKNVNNGKVALDRIWIRDQKDPVIGALVICSTTQCAYRTTDGSFVIGIVDIKSIEHVDSPKNKDPTASSGSRLRDNN